MGKLNRQLDPTALGEQAEKLETELRKKIVGQGEAIDSIVNIYQMFLAGMSTPGRPVGNFLFLGPTGSGKTRLVEATAESLIGDVRAVIKIDCAEFQHSHEIAKLIGSPPGYLGHRETHPVLSKEVLEQYYTETTKLSFVLFDEIEKASDALWNLLLGILDKATLTLGDNRRVDFSHTLIFMTSNLGAEQMTDLDSGLGFMASEESRARAAGVVDTAFTQKISQVAVEAAKRKFSPEFMNRIDKTVVFRTLDSGELRKILGIELNILQHRILNLPQGNPFVFQLTGSAKDHLLAEGTDLKYGARHLKRAIDRSLVHPLSNLIATDQIRGGDMVGVDYDQKIGQMTFIVKEERMQPYAMMQMIEPPIFVPAEVSPQNQTVLGSRGKFKKVGANH